MTFLILLILLGLALIGYEYYKKAKSKQKELLNNIQKKGKKITNSDLNDLIDAWKPTIRWRKWLINILVFTVILVPGILIGFQAFSAATDVTTENIMNQTETISSILPGISVVMVAVVVLGAIIPFFFMRGF